MKQLSPTLFCQDKTFNIWDRKCSWLTEVSSSFSWARLSSKSCSRVSVRPLRRGGAGRTAAAGDEDEGGGRGEERGQEEEGGGGEETQGWAVIKEREGWRTKGRGDGEEMLLLSETTQNTWHYLWHHLWQYDISRSQALTSVSVIGQFLAVWVSELFCQLVTDWHKLNFVLRLVKLLIVWRDKHPEFISSQFVPEDHISDHTRLVSFSCSLFQIILQKSTIKLFTGSQSLTEVKPGRFKTFCDLKLSLIYFNGLNDVDKQSISSWSSVVSWLSRSIKFSNDWWN